MAVHRSAQAHRHLLQDVVARLAAEQVVDGLEAVEVEYADGKGCRIVRAIRDQAVDLVEEPALVAESRQRIRECQIRGVAAAIAL